MLPYQVLMQTKDLVKSDLPKEAQGLIKKLDATVRSVGNLVGKKDEEGNYIVTPNTRSKIDKLDREIVNAIWDYLDAKQSEEIKKEFEGKQVSKPTEKEKVVEEPIETTKPVVENKKEEENPPKQEPRKGNIGFFEW